MFAPLLLQYLPFSYQGSMRLELQSASLASEEVFGSPPTPQSLHAHRNTHQSLQHPCNSVNGRAPMPVVTLTQKRGTTALH